jgi:hypothetical protein
MAVIGPITLKKRQRNQAIEPEDKDFSHDSTSPFGYNGPSGDGLLT